MLNLFHFLLQVSSRRHSGRHRRRRCRCRRRCRRRHRCRRTVPAVAAATAAFSPFSRHVCQQPLNPFSRHVCQLSVLSLVMCANNLYMWFGKDKHLKTFYFLSRWRSSRRSSPSIIASMRGLRAHAEVCTFRPGPPNKQWSAGAHGSRHIP